MKTNLRLILASVLLACVAALGFSHGAWAGPLMAGTVPGCPTSGVGGEFTTCTATATGPNFMITDVDMPTLDGNSVMVPGSLNNGPAVDLEANGNFTALCFPDIDTPPVGNIWMWNAVTSTWVFMPTYHTSSMTCTYTNGSGIYTIEY